MIKVENLCKSFKTKKKYPGFKGAIKSFFSKEYIIKKAVDDISFNIKAVSYTHLTLPTKNSPCRSRWSPYH